MNVLRPRKVVIKHGVNVQPILAKRLFQCFYQSGNLVHETFYTSNQMSEQLGFISRAFGIKYKMRKQSF